MPAEEDDPVGECLSKLLAMSKLSQDPHILLKNILEQERRMPDEPELKVVKGITQMQTGEHEKALVSFDEAITLNPRSFWAYYHKGRALMSLGRSKDALECFDKAVSIRKNKPEIWVEKALCEDELALLGQAYESYEKAVQAGDKTGRGWFGKSRILAYINRFDEALEAVRTAQKLDPDEEEYRQAQQFILDKLRGY
jgi:tetratricopeptide (TPR) repeat protein